jgi:hypothetical protein
MVLTHGFLTWKTMLRMMVASPPGERLVTPVTSYSDLKVIRDHLDASESAKLSKEQRKRSLIDAVGLICRDLRAFGRHDEFWDEFETRREQMSTKVGGFVDVLLTPGHLDPLLDEIGTRLDEMGWPPPPAAGELKELKRRFSQNGTPVHRVAVRVMMARANVRDLAKKACELHTQLMRRVDLSETADTAFKSAGKWARRASRVLLILMLFGGVPDALPPEMSDAGEGMVDAVVLDGLREQLDGLADLADSLQSDGSN